MPHNVFSSRFIRRFLLSLALVSLAAIAGCTCGGDERMGRPLDGSTGGDAGPCSAGDVQCRGMDVLVCMGGAFVESGETCAGGMVCAPGLGCRACIPGQMTCVGDAVHSCSDDGTTTTFVMECPSDQTCRYGACISACDAARDERSNVGCEYYAVDLDNEWGQAAGFEIDAAGEQFAVVLANPSDVTVTVIVSRNDAPYGSPPSEATLGMWTINPYDLVRIDLPQREVDGSTLGMNEGPGTFLSGNAYKIRTNYPVVAYQFNPIVQSYSNDASLLIPVTGLDTHYRVLGWPTANPIAAPPPLSIPGIPDHSFVTVVGTEPNTEVVVTLGGPIVGGSGIPASGAGSEVRVTLGPYEVLNLESDMVPGDLSGTVVQSSRPVAVFSGGERGIAPWDPTGVPAHPDGAPERWCCTEHLEEQVFPTSAWGKQFVITRSPVRSAHPTWREPDIYRVMADKNGTVVTTNLAPPYDSFMLNANEWTELYADRSFVMQATEAVSIEQILVSQGWVADWKPDHGGDPSMTLFPPYEQFREDYIFLVPDTFTANYVVLAIPASTTVLLDGTDVNADEFMALCTYEVAGEIEGVTYEAVTCPVDGGTHRIQSSAPVGIVVYGYYSVGSYAFAGGSQLTRINLI